MKRSTKRLVKRVLRSFAQGNMGVIGDIAGVAYQFKDEPFMQDLVKYQVTARFSEKGAYATAGAFLLQDQGFRGLLGGFVGGGN